MVRGGESHGVSGLMARGQPGPGQAGILGFGGKVDPPHRMARRSIYGGSLSLESGWLQGCWCHRDRPAEQRLGRRRRHEQRPCSSPCAQRHRHGDAHRTARHASYVRSEKEPPSVPGGQGRGESGRRAPAGGARGRPTGPFSASDPNVPGPLRAPVGRLWVSGETGGSTKTGAPES